MTQATNKPTKPKILSGVYRITCLANNKNYIGSSDNIMRRLKTHERELEQGSHNNRRLQHDYDKYGSEFFEFRVVFIDIPKEKLTAYEKVAIYLYDSIVMYKGYNDIWPTTNHKVFKEAYQDLLEKGLIPNRKD